jgi:transposase-like protein
MSAHKNARLTVHCRALLIERLYRGEPKAQVARTFAISVKTVQKWLRRYQQEGVSGLQDRSCRPRRSPKATVRELSLAVLALRRQRLTMLGIARQLGLSRSTVARICATAGLQRLSRLQPPAAIQRYERAQPGELLHLDVKNSGESLVLAIALPAIAAVPTAKRATSSCTWQSMTPRGWLMPKCSPMSRVIASLPSRE